MRGNGITSMCSPGPRARSRPSPHSLPAPPVSVLTSATGPQGTGKTDNSLHRGIRLEIQLLSSSWGPPRFSSLSLSPHIQSRRESVTLPSDAPKPDTLNTCTAAIAGLSHHGLCLESPKGLRLDPGPRPFSTQQPAGSIQENHAVAWLRLLQLHRTPMAPSSLQRIDLMFSINSSRIY